MFKCTFFLVRVRYTCCIVAIQIRDVYLSCYFYEYTILLCHMTAQGFISICVILGIPCWSCRLLYLLMCSSDDTDVSCVAWPQVQELRRFKQHASEHTARLRRQFTAEAQQLSESPSHACVCTCVSCPGIQIETPLNALPTVGPLPRALSSLCRMSLLF